MSKARFFGNNSDGPSSDSDDDYTENEKILLDNVRNKQFKDSDSEAEVFSVGSGSDEDQNDIALSDVEGQDDKFVMPDVRAWGKQKSKFYSTDYVDPDYGGFQGKDAHLAELEEEEARNLQQQLAQQLDDDDFKLDVPSKMKSDEDDRQIPEELIKSDISKLSTRQKLQLLQKEAPEFFGLVEDFEVKMTIVKDHLAPTLEKYRNGKIPNTPAVQFVTTLRDLILNYCVNIYMYLLLRASKTNVQNHPVVKRLYQYRQLLGQLIPVFEEIIEPQIRLLLQEKQAESKNKKTLNVVSKLTDEADKKKVKKRQQPQQQQKSNKKVKFDKVIEHEIPQKDKENKDENHEAEEDENEIGKRAITYQIAKNKGLTPHRKKEQRNPRVKHRNKFRKAKIRRKGAVREPRTEMTRYGGEVSGIKTNVSKSVKIKS